MPTKILAILFTLLGFYGTLYGQVEHKVDSLEKELERTTDIEVKSDILNNISDLFINSDISRSRAYAWKAFTMSKEENNTKGQLYACLQLAKVYYYQSDLDSAMEFAMKAKDLATETGQDDFLAISMDAIGMIYYDIGNQAKSSEYFFASLKIYESLNNKNGLGGTYCRIGALYLEQKDYKKAAEYFSNSIDLAKEVNNSMGIASNLNYLAKVYFNEGDYSKAIETYQEAIRINQQIGQAYLEASNYLNLSDVYITLEDYPTAIGNLEKAREIYQNLGNSMRFAKSMSQLSDIYLKTGELDKGEQLALEALAIGQAEKFKEIIISSSKVLYQLYIEKKDSGTALKYFILEKQYQDSLFLDEKTKTLAALELQHQFDKKEAELLIARQRRIVVIAVISGGVFFSLVILVLLVRYFRMKAKKLQLEKAGFERELEFKNKELVLNVMSLMQKNEMLADLSHKLISIDESATTPESKDTIRKVARELQKSQDKEIWKEFSTRFKEVHGDFYERLLQKYPDLTPNELKLCAFLRLNMSSKDIAELTGQRVSSLETARYRLRQKLGIANSDVNLVTFLSSI
jgi:tetratricopeptide (TPR) repeat protein